MVGLPLFDIGVICTGQDHSVDKLDVVHPACNSVQAVSKATSEFENTKDGEC